MKQTLEQIYKAKIDKTVNPERVLRNFCYSILDYIDENPCLQMGLDDLQELKNKEQKKLIVELEEIRSEYNAEKLLAEFDNISFSDDE